MATNQQLAFVRTYAAAAVAAGRVVGLSALVILSQAAHEGQWGTSFSVRTRKNHFGMIAAGSKNAFWDGVSKTQSTASGLWFRVYKSHEASFEDFASLISRKYKAAFACAKNPVAYADAIAASPYISEQNGDDRPAYARALKANAVTIAAIAKQLNISLT